MTPAAVTAQPVAVSGVTLAPGGIETMARTFVDMLAFPEGDPRHLISELAVKLARRVDDEGAVPAAVRELRVLLMQLAESPNSPAAGVDELRARRAQRRLDQILNAAG